MNANSTGSALFFVRVFGFFRPDWRQVVLLLAIIGCSTLLGLAHIWPFALLADVVLVPSGGGGGGLLAHLPHGVRENTLAQIVLLAAAALVLRICQELLSLARSLLHGRIAHRGLLRVRCALFRKLQALSLDFHRTQPQGDTIYRLMQDSPGCEQILGVWIEVGVAMLTLAVMLLIMFSRSVELSLVALAVVPLLLATNVFFGRRLKLDSSAARQFDSRLTSVAQRSMANIALMQAFQRENSEFESFSQAADASAAACLRVQWRMAFYRLSVGVIFGAGGAAILGYGGLLVHRGQLALGDLIVFTAYLAMFYDPLCKISGVGANLHNGVAGIRRVFEVLDRNPAIVERPDLRELACEARTLELQDVTFAYRGGRNVLTGISARIEPGQLVAFVGSSGAGKSSLLNLLPRFYDPTSGRITLDGIDVRDVRLRDLRRHIALVLQENVILPTTIEENIAYGRPDAKPGEIEQAAFMAGAHEFIASLPDGYQTVIAENGANLSGGQRQRIAIARALLTQCPFIVFDEPTSALDPIHEQQFVDQVQRLRGERTIVMVSHRLSTVQHCDQIFVIDQGLLVESGTHRELLARREAYWRLARCQQHGQVAERAESLAHVA